MPISTFWLYRTGRSLVDSNFHRYIFGETWASTDPEGPLIDLTTVLGTRANQMATPFGVHAGLLYTNGASYWERIFPKRQVLSLINTTPRPFVTPLNAAAPEAAFRLQRVGAHVSGSRGIGRLCLPILTDTYYLDLPHRRHVDVATLAPFIAANIEVLPKSITYNGRTYTNCIFDRRDLSWTPLDHYNLLPNPVRIWQRWRTYDYVHRGTRDSTWSPQEL